MKDNNHYADEESDKLKSLRQSATFLKSEAPPEAIWNALEKNLPKPGRSFSSIFLPIAASAILLISIGVGVQNFLMNRAFELVLLENRELEKKLKVNTHFQSNRTAFFLKLNDINQELEHAESDAEKISILQKRGKLISTQISEQNKGVNNVFRI